MGQSGPSAADGRVGDQRRRRAEAGPGGPHGPQRYQRADPGVKVAYGHALACKMRSFGAPLTPRREVGRRARGRC